MLLPLVVGVGIPSVGLTIGGDCVTTAAVRQCRSLKSPKKKYSAGIPIRCWFNGVYFLYSAEQIMFCYTKIIMLQIVPMSFIMLILLAGIY